MTTSNNNLGPITTSQPLPESCVEEYDTVYKIYTTPDGWYWLQGGVLETSCFPSGYAARTEQYYSPASCPAGFTPACQSQNSIGSVTETVHICCPTQQDYECQTIASYEWETTLGCVSRVTQFVMMTWTVIAISNGITVTRISEGFEGGLNALSIQVRFQESDFASATSSVSISPATRTSGSPQRAGDSSSSTGTRSSSSSYGSNENISEGSRIGLGVLVGIIIGGLAGLALIIGVIAVLGRKRRRHAPRDPPPPVEMATGEVRQTGQTYYKPHAAELHSQPAFPPVEMDGGNHPSLEWTQRRYGQGYG